MRIPTLIKVMSEGSILVIGGCGCVGFHIVNALLEEKKTWSSVHVMSRNPSRNRVTGASYHAGDITSPEQVHKLFAEIQPRVIIHAASPNPSADDRDDRSFFNTNVKGTQNLLDCAASSDHVKAFVYTSTASVMEGSSFNFTKETAPTLTNASRADLYAKSKSVAEKLVLDVNEKAGFRTACLRIPVVYGERDNQMIPESLKILQAVRHRNQIGDNSNLFDCVSTQNVAAAHVLAAKALLRARDKSLPKVDGEAFFITDGDPLPFWDLLRKIWDAAGDQTSPEEIRVIPAWFMLSLASTVEWLYWIFTLGKMRPKMRRFDMEFTCSLRTYSIEKAKERLGYTPVGNRDEHIRKGVEWALRMEVEASKPKSS